MAEKAGKDTGVQTGTPYDDVFRTLLNDCRQLVIQLVNEVFGENYTGEEEVVFSPNEHFLNQQDEEKLNTLRGEYRMIVKHLNDLEYSNRLSTYYKKTLIEMSEKVVDNLTAGYENIRKGVKTVMGGKILEYEAKTILRQGEQKGRQEGLQAGRQEGRQLGRLETLVQNIKGLMKTMGWSAEQAMDMMQVSEEDRAAVSSRL